MLCAFPYYGGKTRYAKQIAKRMPEHKRYVEAFGGGASVLLNKSRSKIEVYNDRDEHLVNFFRVLRNREDELREWLDSALYARADHEEWARQFYGDKDLDEMDDVVRAGRWFTLRHTQYGGIVKSVSGFSTPYRRNEAQSMRSNIERLDAIRERFQNVVVECGDWLFLVDTYDGEKTFWYFDPPYVGNEHEYRGEFDHGEFVDALEELEGDWMVSYRALPDGLEEIAETVDTFEATDRADGTKKATEKLVMNYEPSMEREFNQRSLADVCTDGGRRE